MSWRQIRKNNNLLPQVHHQESSDDEDGSSSSSSGSEDEKPKQPMFVTKQKQAKKAVAQKVVDSGANNNNTKNNDEQQQQPPQKAEATAKKPPVNNNNNNNTAKKQPPANNKNNKNPSGNNKKNNSKNNNSAAPNKKESADDKLLRELEKQRRRDQGLPSDDSSSDRDDLDDDDNEHNSKPPSLTSARDIIESLLAIEHKFSSRVYDPRTERIARFGKDSVEKVSDDNNAKKRFRPSPFVTPNQSHWPPFDVYGAQLRKKENNNNSNNQSSSSSSAIKKAASEYVVDVSSDESAKAEASLQNAIDSSDLDSLFAHWRKYNYHLPTLMQVYRTASMINQDEVARQAIDMALYTTGILLAGFPETGSYFRDRRLNGRASHGSAMILQVLHLGVHQALKKGCGRTAFELCKLLLSLDCEDDVECAWAIIDYVAIRASQFDWLQTLARALAIFSKTSSQELSSSASHQSQQNYLYHSLIERYRVLPQLVFGPALAFCFQHDSDKETEKCYAEAVLPAVRRMPRAAVEIATAVGIPDNCPGMAQILLLTDRSKNDAQDRIVHLYVKRNTELWRTKNLPGLLRRAIIQYGTEEVSSNENNASSNNNSQHQLVSLVQRHYGFDDNEDHIMGANPQAVPNDILNGAGGGHNNNNNNNDHDDDGDDFEDDHGNVVRRGHGGGGGIALQRRFVLPPETPQYLRDTLLRFEALFGPLNPQQFQLEPGQQGISLNDLFARYDEMLRDRINERRHQENNNNDQTDHHRDNATSGNTANNNNNNNNNFLTGAAATFVDFFRTMIPDLSSITTSRNDMLLKELKDSGIADPVQAQQEQFDRDHSDDVMFEPARTNDE